MAKITSLPYKGGSITFNTEGKGNVVVFLHGFLESREIWSEFSANLSNKYKVICIDLPGHGESSNYGYCHSMEFMAESVLFVLKHLKIRMFHLIGHSMGGYVSMAIAEMKPDNIRGLCMFHSTADNDSEAKIKERRKVMKVVQKNKSLFLKTAIPNLFDTRRKPYKRSINALIKCANKMTVQGIIAAIEGMIIRSNQEIVLKFAPYPVLYIIGENDKILSSQKLINEANLNENSEVLLLNNAAHMGFIEEKDSCLKAIRKWMQKGQL